MERDCQYLCSYSYRSPPAYIGSETPARAAGHPDGWKKFEDIEAAKANGWDGPWIDAKGFLNPAPSEKGNLDCTIDDGNFRTSREATFVPTDREFEMLRSDPEKAAWYER